MTLGASHPWHGHGLGRLVEAVEAVEAAELEAGECGASTKKYSFSLYRRDIDKMELESEIIWI